MNNKSLREQLILLLGIPENQLNRLILRAPHTYKVYTIPKKSNGERIIAQPAKETKYIQHWLISNIFDKLPIHKAAMAYKSGASIKKNASIHSSNSFIVKLDFKNFFTSVKDEHIRKHFENYLIDFISKEDINDMVRISCIKFKSRDSMCLSIGAPSSPILSNSIMYDFDCEVDEWCMNNNIVYTRYADDITFSTNTKNISNEIEDVVRKIVTKLEYPKLRFNTKKTTHLSKKHQRRITGLIINNDGQVSLGRTRKRMISSLIHKYTISDLDENLVFKLQGLLGFAKDVEPIFISKMQKKYGVNIIDEIFKKRMDAGDNKL